MVLSFEQALSTVKEKLGEAAISPQAESVPLGEAWRRVLAEDINADRDYPPFHRATRDGFAIRAQDAERTPAALHLAGEVRAGQHFNGVVPPGKCVQVMTGAPLPEGTDAVVMVEHAQVKGSLVEISRPVARFENVVGKGSEARMGAPILKGGTRLGAGELGLVASVGRGTVAVFRKPRVSILSTGDEVVPAGSRPKWFQIRDSNSVALSAAVATAGAEPREVGIAPDEQESLRRKIRECFEADLVLITGGVSAGKYDYVEGILGELGAEFYFDGVAMRPGRPLVFGRARGKFFFGLPGNPVSTFVTFHIFARPAILMLGGAPFESPIFFRARLEQPLSHRPGLTTFMPARVRMESGDAVVGLVGWQGSGDLVGVAEANCFVVAHPLHENQLAAGDWVDVLPKPV